MLEPLERLIHTVFLPSLTDQGVPNQADRHLFALPTRLGGLGILNPVINSRFQFDASLNYLFIHQDESYSCETYYEQFELKKEIKCSNRIRVADEAEICKSKLVGQMVRAVELASEKGASSWLVALPIVEHGFLLHKSAFKDALCLRYGWQPSDLPSECVCGASFTVEHALSCPRGGFRHCVIMRFVICLLSCYLMYVWMWPLNLICYP